MIVYFIEERKFFLYLSKKKIQFGILRKFFIYETLQIKISMNTNL